MYFKTINLILSPEEAKGKRNNIVDSIQTALGVNIQDDISSIKMLDVGCRAGNLIRYARSIGVDAQGIDVNRFHNNHDLPIVQGRIENMPFEDNTFNLVYAYGVFDPRLYPQDLSVTITEVVRVMQAKGLFAILDMDMPDRDITRQAGLDCIYRPTTGWNIFQKR